MADNPNAQDGGRTLLSRQRKAQFINLTETVVSAMRGIFGGGGCLLKSLAQCTCAGKRNAQRGLEDPRLVFSISMEHVEGIVLQFRAKVRSFTIGKLHAPDLSVPGG